MESSSTPPLSKSSQPLHNFELSHLKWNMLAQSSSQKKRSRSMKSPPGRHPTSPPYQAAAVQESKTPLPESPAHGEAENQPMVRDEAVRPFRKRSWVWESEAVRKGNDGLVECHPDPSKANSGVAEVKTGVSDSLNLEQGEKKPEKKLKAEEDAGGIKRSKILIKIPNIKNRKEDPEEEKSKEGGVMKIGNNGDQVQDKGKMSGDFDNDTKISEFRTRKLVKSKSQKVNSGGEKGSAFRFPEKNKAQPAVMKINANKSGVKEGTIGGGGEKKEITVGDFNGGAIKEKGKEKVGGLNKKDEGSNGGLKEKEKLVGDQKKEKLGEGEIVKKKEKKDEGEGEIKKKKKVVSLNGSGEKKAKVVGSNGGDKAKAGGSNGGDKAKAGGSNGGDQKDKSEHVEKKAKAGGGSNGGGDKTKLVKSIGEKKDNVGGSNGNGSGDKMKAKSSGEEHKAVEKKEKKKLSISISLTKEEIEEDIYALTGAKPARRPKKRSKNVQKNLDAVFPGLWLVSITPETYKG